MSWNRRDFLKGLGGSGLALSVRAAAIGVPVNFLLTGSVQASEITPKTVVMAISSRGEAFNCNAPGSYGNLSDGDDVKNNIIHPSAGNGVTGTIAGETVDASYFAADTSVMISMGEQQVRAPQAYQLLPQDFLDSMALVYHRTGTNAHPEFGSVLELMGALKSQAGNGSEQLPTAIAEEISLPEFRNSLFDLPMPVSNQKITAAGKPINRYSPTGMKQIISSGGSFVASYSDFDAIYKSTRLLGRIGLSYCATNNPSIGPSKLLPRFLMLCAA